MLCALLCQEQQVAELKGVKCVLLKQVATTPTDLKAKKYQQTVSCRRNQIDEAGWHVVMDGLASVKSIMSFNCVDELEELFTGGVNKAALSRKCLQMWEATVAISRLLLLSKWTLDALSLRLYKNSSTKLF